MMMRLQGSPLTRHWCRFSTRPNRKISSSDSPTTVRRRLPWIWCRVSVARKKWMPCRLWLTSPAIARSSRQVTTLVASSPGKSPQQAKYNLPRCLSLVLASRALPPSAPHNHSAPLFVHLMSDPKSPNKSNPWARNFSSSTLLIKPTGRKRVDMPPRPVPNFARSNLPCFVNKHPTSIS